MVSYRSILTTLAAAVGLEGCASVLSTRQIEGVKGDVRKLAAPYDSTTKGLEGQLSSDVLPENPKFDQKAKWAAYDGAKQVNPVFENYRDIFRIFILLRKC